MLPRALFTGGKGGKGAGFSSLAPLKRHVGVPACGRVMETARCYNTWSRGHMFSPLPAHKQSKITLLDLNYTTSRISVRTFYSNNNKFDFTTSNALFGTYLILS
jgi:hypothetical protein